MRLAPALIVALFVVFPLTLAAQTWSAEEQEIIDLNQSCWEAWASEDLNAVRATCNEHPDARGWYTPEGLPAVGWFAKNASRWLSVYGPRDEWIYFEVRPASVRIFDNTALIHFWAMHTHEDAQGAVTTQTQKHLNIWQRIDGEWTWIGGMAHPEGDRVW